MNRSETSQEQGVKDLLSQAARRVAQAYFVDKAGEGYESPEERDARWDNLRQKYPAFADKIEALKEAMSRATVARVNYTNRSVIVALELGYKLSGMEDESGITFLTDVLLSHFALGAGNITRLGTSGLEISQEAEQIVAEVSSIEGIEKKGLSKFSAVDGVQAALTGVLSIRQPSILEKSFVFS